MATAAEPTNGTSPVPGDDPKSSPDYVQFKCLPPGGPLNRWSTTLTREHDFPGAQVREGPLPADEPAPFLSVQERKKERRMGRLS